MMRAAFYCGMGAGGDWKARATHLAISRISAPHTHVELIFSDGMSSSSEFGIGPRLKRIGYSHPERWTIIDLPFITPEMEARIRRRAELLAALCQAGFLKYDIRGAVGCTWTGIQRPWMYFCSEIVYEVLAPEIAIPSLNFKMHPQRLLEVLQVIAKLEEAWLQNGTID